MDIVFTVLVVWVVMGIECVICRYIARQDSYWCHIILCITSKTAALIPDKCGNMSKEDTEVLLKIRRRAFFFFFNTRHLLQNAERRRPGFAAACKAGRYVPPDEEPAA